MTDTRKLENQTVENKSKATGELKDTDLDNVTGGGLALQTAFSNVIKSVGEALATAARKA